MKKIPSLFKRNYKTHNIYDEITEGCEWVIKGEGTPTRKFDGTACMIMNDKLYKRYDYKKGRRIVVTVDNIPCQEAPDPETGHWPWWVPIEKNDKYHKEAFERMPIIKLDGTYELCGPKINGNPEGFKEHVLIKHGCEILENCPTQYDVLPQYMIDKKIEGIVWYRNGYLIDEEIEMCKVKLKDFGIKRRK